MFGHLSVWLNVPERERKELYTDITNVLDKKEKEEARLLKKRNIKVLQDILESMAKVTYKTRWSEAQKLLFKNVHFMRDTELQNMDKEDALIVFTDHIKTLERDHTEDIEKRKNWCRRQERKNRENFLAMLDELRESGKLVPTSLWTDLFATISADERFAAMLHQGGSSPLDLFKLYVDDLKLRYYEDRKLIKEIVRDKRFDMQLTTTLDQFSDMLHSDKQRVPVPLDACNVRLAYRSMMEKIEEKEREKQRDEAKKSKRLEQAFKSMLKKHDVNESDKYERVRERIAHEDAFLAVDDEHERERLFDEYAQTLQEACLHHVKKKKTDKEKDKDKDKEKERENRGDKEKDKEREKEKDKKVKKSKRSRSRSTSPPGPPSATTADVVMAEAANDAADQSSGKSSAAPAAAAAATATVKESETGELTESDQPNAEMSIKDEPGKEKKSSSKKHKKSKKRKRQKSVYNLIQTLFCEYFSIHYSFKFSNLKESGTEEGEER